MEGTVRKKQAAKVVGSAKRIRIRIREKIISIAERKHVPVFFPQPLGNEMPQVSSS